MIYMSTLFPHAVREKNSMFSCFIEKHCMYPCMIEHKISLITCVVLVICYLRVRERRLVPTQEEQCGLQPA